VYPVWSRRAQGISIGINLHPNRCCNWRCIYCQAPGLKRGRSPTISIEKLEQELVDCLNWISREMQAHGKGDALWCRILRLPVMVMVNLLLHHSF
jgi:wyosine [tRNA(Phe)-imidazoG37] synthetase (radical SAM superfamily)